MKIQIIKGSFPAHDAKELLTKMIRVKIHYQEDRISKSDREEDIKMRERRIVHLQNDLKMALSAIGNAATAQLDASIEIEMRN
jgi:hypothetical protein